MLIVSCKQNGWLEQAIAGVRDDGCAAVTDVLDDDFLTQTRERMYAVQRTIRDEVGEEKLTRAGELGVLRLMVRYDDHFLRFLELPEVLAVVDNSVSDTAILHLQKKIETALQRIGLSPEARKFSAHVTLARMKGASHEKVVQFLTHHALFASGPFPVDHFVLFSSQLSHGGSIYHPERLYPLTSLP